MIRLKVNFIFDSESSILLFAKMTAPTIAASNKIEAISNGSIKSVKSNLSNCLCGAEAIHHIPDFNQRIIYRDQICHQ